MNDTDLIALNRKVFYARKEWYELIDKYFIDERYYQGNSDRSKVKTIYFVERGRWAEEILRKIKFFQNKFINLGYVGLSKPKRLWLPTVIEGADEITVVAYAAYSQRQMSADQTRNYKSKHGKDSISSTDKKGVFRTASGRDYKIRVAFEGTIAYYPFTEWVICLCKNKKLPEVKNLKNKSG